MTKTSKMDEEKKEKGTKLTGFFLMQRNEKLIFLQELLNMHFKFINSKNGEILCVEVNSKMNHLYGRGRETLKFFDHHPS